MTKCYAAFPIHATWLEKTFVVTVYATVCYMYFICEHGCHTNCAALIYYTTTYSLTASKLRYKTRGYLYELCWFVGEKQHRSSKTLNKNVLQ